MKLSFYFDEGRKQLVFTPETDYEKKLLKTVEDSKNKDLSWHWGGFYACQGGWTRHERYSDAMDNLVLVIDEEVLKRKHE